MEKKILISIAIIALILLFFFLPKNTISVQEGRNEIVLVLASNNLSEADFFLANIIYIEDGELVNDYSTQQFAKLTGDLLNLQNRFKELENSKDKTVLIEALDVYFGMIELEKKEKQLFLEFNELERKFVDFPTACANFGEFKDLSDKDFDLTLEFSELDSKNFDLLLNNPNTSEVDSLLLEIIALEEIDLYPHMFDDINALELLCLELEGENQ